MFDKLYLDPNGTLAANDFVIGARATEAHAKVIYIRSTGVLSYDADGTARRSAAQEIAVIGRNLTFVDHNDIQLA